jgi:hypothetical protein
MLLALPSKRGKKPSSRGRKGNLTIYSSFAQRRHTAAAGKPGDKKKVN